MKSKNITGFRILAFLMLISIAVFNASTCAAANVDTEKQARILENNLSRAVDNYNAAVTAGTIEDVATCVEKIDQIVSELDCIGMDVEFTQTSDVTVISENEVMPATISVCVGPSDEKSTTSERESHSLNEKQLEKLNQVYGQDMSLGTYMEMFFPEAQADQSQEEIERDYATPMIWPEKDATNEKLRETESGSTLIFSLSESLSGTLVKTDILTHLVSGTSSISASSGKISFSSKTRMVLPTPWTTVPEMRVFSYLYDPDDDIIDAAYKQGTNVYQIKASGSETVSVSGYYATVGSHYVTYPPGVTTPGWCPSDSGSYYVSA